MTIEELGSKFDELFIYRLGEGEDYKLILDNEDGTFHCDLIHYSPFSKDICITIGEFDFKVEEVIVNGDKLYVRLDHSIYEAEWYSNRSNYTCNYEDEVKEYNRTYLFTLQKVKRSYENVSLTS